jgi:hypothetical protein
MAKYVEQQRGFTMIDSYQKRHNPKTPSSLQRLTILVLGLLLAFVVLGLILTSSGAWVALGLMVTFVLGMFVGLGMRQRNTYHKSATLQLPSRPQKTPPPLESVQPSMIVPVAVVPVAVVPVAVVPVAVVPVAVVPVAVVPVAVVPVVAEPIIPEPVLEARVLEAPTAPLERKTWKPKAKTETPEVPEVLEIPSSIETVEPAPLERKTWKPKAKTETPEVPEVLEIPSSIETVEPAPLERKKWTPKAKTETPETPEISPSRPLALSPSDLPPSSERAKWQPKKKT